ncbi:MAG TPA: hypothetical protein VJN48_11375 [Terriglobales bacterium]|nr:hypothetical protein [Terriglobales bacterium]
MRRRYGPEASTEAVNIEQGEWHAFKLWVEDSPEDAKTEQEFWRRYIGRSRKRLAQAINFIYPGGCSWSDDPKQIISKLFRVEELRKLLEELHGEELNDVEHEAVVRFQALLRDEWFDIHRLGGSVP